MVVVLHICCGVCAIGAGEHLLLQGYRVIGFFYNPNIQPLQEYKKRVSVAKGVADKLGFPLIEGDYELENWQAETAEFKDEPEGGKRCEVCFEIRLRKTFELMNRLGAEGFTSTLSTSPHKSFAIITEIGRKIGRDKFLAVDFKKRDGFKRSINRAKDWKLYRQNYCGCVYSMKSF